MKKLSVKHLNKSMLMIFAAVGVMAFSSCSDDDDNQKKSTTPDEQAYTTLSDAAISEFLAFAKNPRPGNTAAKHDNLDKARDYLVNWAKQHNYDVHYDEHPNIWIDVPANNASMRNFPTVILQGHIDMICASKSGETYDYTQVVGEPYYDGDLLKGSKVNLGADDGIGVGMALAIASSDIAHGPLRLLFTANEDYDMEGAINLDPEVINSDYLICLDEEEIGKVSSGCLGSYIIDFDGILPSEIIDDNESFTGNDGNNVIQFNLTGLPGGHSGVMIGQHILSASTVTAKIIKDVVTPAAGRISYINCGTYANAISDATTVEFIVESSKADYCISQIKSIMETYQTEYSDVAMKYSAEKVANPTSSIVAAESANATINKFFEEVKQGVIERDDINVPTKSSNIGTIYLLGDQFMANAMFRSYFNEWLEEEKARLLQVRTDLNMEGSTELQHVPAWSVEGGNSFRDTFLTYYKENWSDAFSERAYGGLECAYFVKKRTTLKAIAVGPQLDGAHTIDEAVHVSTIKPLMKSIVKMLQNMDKME
jgi:dipeptidase D